MNFQSRLWGAVRPKALLGAVAAALLLLASGMAVAQDGALPAQEPSQIRLVSAAASVSGGTELWLGVHMVLAEGWETYWRSPGEAGLPPTFEWGGSANISGAEVSWPAPETIVRYGLTMYGYTREVLFPVHVTVPDPSRPVTVRLLFRYAVCADICIATEADLALDFPTEGAAADPVAGRLIDFYRARVPAPQGEGGMRVESAALDSAGVLELELASPVPFRAPRAIIEAAPGWVLIDPVVEISGDGLSARVRGTVPGAAAAANEAAPAEITVTLVDGTRAIEARVPLRRPD